MEKWVGGCREGLGGWEAVGKGKRMEVRKKSEEVGKEKVGEGGKKEKAVK